MQIYCSYFKNVLQRFILSWIKKRIDLNKSLKIGDLFDVIDMKF